MNDARVKPWAPGRRSLEVWRLLSSMQANSLSFMELRIVHYVLCSMQPYSRGLRCQIGTTLRTILLNIIRSIRQLDCLAVH
jgi:hypothetical protein